MILVLVQRKTIMKTSTYFVAAFLLSTTVSVPLMTYGQARPQPRTETAAPPAPQPVSAPTNPISRSSIEAERSAPVRETGESLLQTAGNRQIAAVAPTDSDDQVIPAPTLMSYQEVKDNFGRRIADSYLVVQVNIKNPDIAHQFLLQDLRVIFDPNECDNAKEFYEHLDVQACRVQYNKYLRYPIAYAPISQSSLQAVAGIGQNQNPRNVLFRSLDFLATMGGALTGFDFVGRDGKAGLSVFNGTFLTASRALFPDLTVGQLTQLTEQSYKPNTLLESKDSKTYCIFIPTNQLFAKETWKLYKQKPKDSSPEALELRRFLQLVLTVTASGVHIQQAAGSSETNVTGGGAARPSPNQQ
jgi:hypothetical protein